MSNLNIVDDLDEKDEHNLICLYDKTNCNCCICAGLYVESIVSTVPVFGIKAKYYQADAFMNFLNNNSLEPAGVDISEGWVAVDSSQDYSIPIDGTAGSGFTVWRFQPNFESNYL